MFEITITETTWNKGITREYKKLHDLDKFDKDNNPQYGYVKDEWGEEKTRTVLRQQVAQIDVTEVIKAINGIK